MSVGGYSRSDTRKYRTREEERKWRDRDPIEVFAKYVTEHGIFSDAQVEAIRAEVKAVIEDAAKFALESPDARPEELYDALWAE